MAHMCTLELCLLWHDQGTRLWLLLSKEYWQRVHTFIHLPYYCYCNSFFFWIIYFLQYCTVYLYRAVCFLRSPNASFISCVSLITRPLRKLLQYFRNWELATNSRATYSFSRSQGCFYLAEMIILNCTFVQQYYQGVCDRYSNVVLVDPISRGCI